MAGLRPGPEARGRQVLHPLAYAQDRKQEDVRYSIASFRRDIQQAGMFRPSPDGQPMQDGFQQPVPLPALEQRACPWLRVLCVRSGKPVAIDECQDCEFEKSTFCETNPN